MKPPITGHDAISGDSRLVHNWRVSQLTRLGVPWGLAEIYADRVDWHQVARFGCLASVGWLATGSVLAGTRGGAARRLRRSAHQAT
jgi:hypothetical protein